MKCLGNPDTGKPYVPADAGQQVGLTNKYQEKPEALNHNALIYKLIISFDPGFFILRIRFRGKYCNSPTSGVTFKTWLYINIVLLLFAKKCPSDCGEKAI